MPSRPILITGFQPYGGRGLNPAHEAMRKLDGRTIAGRSVVGRGLPVSLAGLRGEIDRLVDDIDPAAVISLGLWPGETAIRIERVAVNIADFEIPDNDGALVVDGLVVDAGPGAHLATLPLRAIEHAILGEGIPARVSATAGTFLCNACLYGFLAALAARRRAVACGFIHVPYLPEQVADLLVSLRKGASLELHQRTDLASMSLDRIVRAIEIAVAETAAAMADAGA